MNSLFRGILGYSIINHLGFIHPGLTFFLHLAMLHESHWKSCFQDIEPALTMANFSDIAYPCHARLRHFDGKALSFIIITLSCRYQLMNSKFRFDQKFYCLQAFWLYKVQSNLFLFWTNCWLRHTHIYWYNIYFWMYIYIYNMIYGKHHKLK